MVDSRPDRLRALRCGQRGPRHHDLHREGQAPDHPLLQLCHHPDFSPDGRRIAFAAGPGGSIYVSRVDGTARRRLNRNGTEPAWSPSGRFIAYRRSSTSGGLSDIYVMRADGTRAHRLGYDAKHRVGTDVTGDYGSPSWQPLPR